MVKKISSIILLVFFALTFFAGCNGENTVTILNNDTYFNIHQYDKKLLASLPEHEISIYATNQIKDFYEDLILEVGDSHREVDWRNVTNPSYAPELYYTDLDLDGKNELIVILTKNFTPGSYIGEIHVMNLSPLAEEKVADPLTIISENVKTSLNGDTINIKINNVSYKFKTRDYTNMVNELYNNIHFNNIVYYNIKNNKLIATCSCQITDKDFIGNIIITYKSYKSTYVMDEIKFQPENQ